MRWSKAVNIHWRDLLMIQLIPDITDDKKAQDVVTTLENLIV